MHDRMARRNAEESVLRLLCNLCSFRLLMTMVLFPSVRSLTREALSRQENVQLSIRYIHVAGVIAPMPATGHHQTTCIRTPPDGVIKPSEYAYMWGK
jgi:hypothetical protein